MMLTYKERKCTNAFLPTGKKLAYPYPTKVNLRQDIEQMLKDGLTIPQMADELGVSPATIYAQLKRMGIKLNKTN